MRLTISDLGKIEKCELEINDLTILVGDNNSGKTYVTYMTYGALKNWSDFIDNRSFKTIEESIIKDGQVLLSTNEIIELMEKSTLQESPSFQRRIRNLFNDKEKIFSDAQVKVEFTKPNLFKDATREIKIGEKNSLVGKMANSILSFTYTRGSDKEFEATILRRLIGDLFASLVFDEIFPDPFIITAERLGISLFYKELDERKNSMIDAIQKLDEEEGDFHHINLIMASSAYYATPIRDHIAFTRKLDEIKKNSTLLDVSEPFEIIKEMLGAEFKKESKQDIRLYTKNKKNNKFDIPLYLASSSARCIVDIYFYLKHISKAGDILIIDEPESHLTLKNQRLMAKLIASIINIGIKVFITTHSDFLIKELNNLILLSNNFKGKDEWLERNKKNYKSSDFLRPTQVSVYQAINGNLSNLNVTNKGIEVPFFDTEIQNLFSISTDLDYLTD